MTKATPLLASIALLGCSAAVPTNPVAAIQTDLVKLSDEFDSPATLKDWKRIDQTEGWNADQLAKCAIEGGNRVLVPHPSTWYMDYRGVLVYKDVAGDFVITAKLKTTGRDGQSAPKSQYSLGGIMIRSPRGDTSKNWSTGKENYVFLSLGAADQPGTYQFEVKTTERSQSNLEKISAGGSEALLQVAKVGPNLVLLRNQGSGWVVHKRYYRPDMPSQLQVGLTVYTDYPSASQLGAREHNATVIKSGNPDLIAKVDYVRYRKPIVPAGLNLAQASDSDLIRLFGDAANR